MVVRAKLKYLRIAPRKIRLVADSIRGKSVQEARAVLGFIVKRGGGPILKLLNQAVSNAKNDFQLNENSLYVSKITVDEGPKLKRWRPRARGQAYEIQKKTSHITIILDRISKEAGRERPLVKKSKKEAPEGQKEAISKKEKPKFRPDFEAIKPKTQKETKKIFKRKAF